MQTLIILGSARKDSHTRTLLKMVFEGTPHELVDLLDYNIATFDYDAQYPESDQFGEVIDKMLSAETIIFATPVYWYAMSGMMKTFFDRFTDLVKVEKYKKQKLTGKRTFLFSVGAENEPPMGFEVPFELASNELGMNYIEGIYLSSRGEDFDSIVQTSRKYLDKINQ